MVFTPSTATQALTTQAALRFNHYVTSGQPRASLSCPVRTSFPTAVTATEAAKASPSITSQLATIALLKLPISFVMSSGINALLFKIPFIKSAGLELLGLAIEAVGTVSVTAAKKYYDTHDTTPDTHTSHEKMLKVAGAGVSLVSSIITISRCIHESPFFKGLPRLWQVLRIVGSIAIGTLCGTLEGHLAGKVTPWIEKHLNPPK